MVRAQPLYHAQPGTPCDQGGRVPGRAASREPFILGVMASNNRMHGATRPAPGPTPRGNRR
jgi:hypothetical protein